MWFHGGAGGEDVGAIPLGDLDRLILVEVQPHRPAGVVVVSLGPKDPAAIAVKDALVNKLVDRPAGLEGRVQLQQRLGPEEAGGHLLLDAATQPLVRNSDETFGVVGIVGDDMPLQADCIHGWRRSRIAISGPEHPRRSVCDTPFTRGRQGLALGSARSPGGVRFSPLAKEPAP